MGVAGGALSELFRDWYCLDLRDGWCGWEHACDNGCCVGPLSITILIKSPDLIMIRILRLQPGLRKLQILRRPTILPLIMLCFGFFHPNLELDYFQRFATSRIPV